MLLTLLRIEHASTIRTSFAVAVVLVTLLVSMAAHAQTDLPADASKVRVRLGPLTITPTIGLTNIGVDQNVFYESVDQQPKSDFTFTITPAIDLRLRLFRSLLVGSVTEDLVWYQKYSTERAANNTLKGTWLIPFNRLSFKVNGTFASVRDRPGFEIDARSRRRESSYDGLAEVRVLPKTFIGATAQQQRVTYDKAAVFLDSNLQFELNHVADTAGVSLRYLLTPITSVSLVTTRTETRFQFSSLRDSDATAVNAVIAFDPQGIISGTATFGYTSFEPRTAGLPNYKGPTAAIDVSYRLLGTMRITVDLQRDVGYSYEVDQPYYVQTGASGSVSRALVGSLDIIGRVGIQSLAYRSRAGSTDVLANRVDDVTTYGGGIGYHMGRRSRLGLNVDKVHRVSDISSREFDDVRFGSSVTYGF